MVYLYIYLWKSKSNDFKGKNYMLLWNTDAPGGNKVKIWPRPNPQGHGMSVKCEELLNELTVQALLLYHNKTLIIGLCKRGGITDRQMDRQTNRPTDDPNTRCPRADLSGLGIIMLTKIWHICDMIFEFMITLNIVAIFFFSNQWDWEKF